MIERLVNNVLDVPGVEGLCLFDRECNILLNQLPDYFIEELFDDALQRVISLYETVDDNFIPCDDYLIKYPGKWIMLRRGKDVFTLIITDEGVNQVTLKMTTNLLLKNVRPDTLVNPAPTPAPAEPTTTQNPRATTRPPYRSQTRAPMPQPAGNTRAPMSANKPAPPKKKPRTFRGQSY